LIKLWNISGNDRDGYEISNQVWSNHFLTKWGDDNKDMGTIYNGRGRWMITPVFSRGDVTWHKLLAIDNRHGIDMTIEREGKYIYPFDKEP